MENELDDNERLLLHAPFTAGLSPRARRTYWRACVTLFLLRKAGSAGTGKRGANGTTLSPGGCRGSEDLRRREEGLVQQLGTTVDLLYQFIVKTQEEGNEVSEDNVERKNEDASQALELEVKAFVKAFVPTEWSAIWQASFVCFPFLLLSLLLPVLPTGEEDSDSSEACSEANRNADSCLRPIIKFTRLATALVVSAGAHADEASGRDIKSTSVGGRRFIVRGECLKPQSSKAIYKALDRSVVQSCSNVVGSALKSSYTEMLRRIPRPGRGIFCKESSGLFESLYEAENALESDQVCHGNKGPVKPSAQKFSCPRCPAFQTFIRSLLDRVVGSSGLRASLELDRDKFMRYCKVLRDAAVNSENVASGMALHLTQISLRVPARLGAPSAVLLARTLDRWLYSNNDSPATVSSVGKEAVDTQTVNFLSGDETRSLRGTFVGISPDPELILNILYKSPTSQHKGQRSALSREGHEREVKYSNAGAESTSPPSIPPSTKAQFVETLVQKIFQSDADVVAGMAEFQQTLYARLYQTFDIAPSSLLKLRTSGGGKPCRSAAAADTLIPSTWMWRLYRTFFSTVRDSVPLLSASKAVEISGITALCEELTAFTYFVQRDRHPRASHTHHELRHQVISDFMKVMESVVSASTCENTSSTSVTVCLENALTMLTSVLSDGMSVPASLPFAKGGQLAVGESQTVEGALAQHFAVSGARADHSVSLNSLSQIQAVSNWRPPGSMSSALNIFADIAIKRLLSPNAGLFAIDALICPSGQSLSVLQHPNDTQRNAARLYCVLFALKKFMTSRTWDVMEGEEADSRIAYALEVLVKAVVRSDDLTGVARARRQGENIKWTTEGGLERRFRSELVLLLLYSARELGRWLRPSSVRGIDIFIASNIDLPIGFLAERAALRKLHLEPPTILKPAASRDSAPIEDTYFWDRLLEYKGAVFNHCWQLVEHIGADKEYGPSGRSDLSCSHPSLVPYAYFGALVPFEIVSKLSAQECCSLVTRVCQVLRPNSSFLARTHNHGLILELLATLLARLNDVLVETLAQRFINQPADVNQPPGIESDGCPSSKDVDDSDGKTEGGKGVEGAGVGMDGVEDEFQRWRAEEERAAYALEKERRAADLAIHFVLGVCVEKSREPQLVTWALKVQYHALKIHTHVKYSLYSRIRHVWLSAKAAVRWPSMTVDSILSVLPIINEICIPFAPDFALATMVDDLFEPAAKFLSDCTSSAATRAKAELCATLVAWTSSSDFCRKKITESLERSTAIALLINEDASLLNRSYVKDAAFINTARSISDFAADKRTVSV